jgi:hypothetical protein
MLRRLRALTKEVRMLKADIDSASRKNAPANLKKVR